jgi:hypothetical protein
VQVLAVHGRTVLAHLRGEDVANRLGVVPHRQGHADVANHGRNDIALPGAVLATVLRAALQADAGGVDGLLAQGAEALALEGHVAPAHLPAHEELLEPIVHGAGERHAAQDLDALGLGERGRDRFTPQEAVEGIGELGARLLHALHRCRPRRGVVGALGRLQRVVEPPRQLAPERHAKPVDGGVVPRLRLVPTDRVEDIEGEMDGQRVTLGDEGGEAAGESGELVGIGGGACHGR